jgi:hypothetical protein
MISSDGLQNPRCGRNLSSLNDGIHRIFILSATFNQTQPTLLIQAAQQYVEHARLGDGPIYEGRSDWKADPESEGEEHATGRILPALCSTI